MGGEAVKSGRAIPQPEVPVKPKTKVPTKPTTPLVVSFGRAVERVFSPPGRSSKSPANANPKTTRGASTPRDAFSLSPGRFSCFCRACATSPISMAIASEPATSARFSYALRSPWLGRVAEAMIRRMGDCAYRNDELVALDSMCNAISNKRRHHCKKINRQVGGVSVLWAFRVAARAGETAVKILGFAEGATHDTLLMHTIQLAARGPVYLMDRGFYCLDLIAKWLAGHVRFIVRVKSGKLIHTEVEHYTDKPFWVRARTGKSRRKSGVLVTFDGLALLGAPGRRGQRPLVRLIVGRLESGESLILASSEMNWAASRLLESYSQRWEIEKWHRIVKRVLGLAHVYSFQSEGLMLLTRAVMLLALQLRSMVPRIKIADIVGVMWVSWGARPSKSGRAIPQPEVPVKPKTKVPTKPTTPLVVSFGRAVERFFSPLGAPASRRRMRTQKLRAAHRRPAMRSRFRPVVFHASAGPARHRR